VPLLRDGAKPGRPRLMFAYRDVQRVVRDDRWKLIRYPQVDKARLFDLRDDPQEATNLADRPGQAARVRALAALLEKEQKRCGDTAPLTVPRPEHAEWTPPVEGNTPRGGRGKEQPGRSVRVPSSLAP